MTAEDRSQKFRDLLEHLEKSSLHFREGGRQILLALEELMAVVAKALEIAGKDQPLIRSFLTAVVLLQGVLTQTAQQIPPYLDRKTLIHYRIETLSLLRDLLRGELLRIPRDGDPLRREGILLAIGFIDQEIERWAVQMQESGTSSSAEYTTIPIEGLEGR
jgi:hypothetical protein